MPSERPAEGWLARLARVCLAHPWWVGGVLLVLVVIAGLVGLPPRVDANIVSLLSDAQPQARALKAVAAESGGINTLTLTFRAEDRARMHDRLDALAEELEALETVSFVHHRLPDDLAEHVRLMGVAPTADGVASIDRSTYAILPIRDLGRLLVKPTRSNIDPRFCQRVVADVEGVLAEADLEADGIEHVFSAGPYVYIADGLEGIVTDLTRTLGVTVVLVVGVLVLGFRSLKAPVVLGLPVAVGALLQLAVLGAVFGSLNTFTSFGTALLVGLGIDSGIHLWMRVRELRREGLDVEDAIARAWDTTGPACVVASLTSAAGFLVLAVAEFRGLAHLGVSLSLGLVLCLIATLVLLPPLLRALDRGAPRPAWSVLPDAVPLGRLPAGLLLGGLVVAGIAAGIFGAYNLQFQHDITRMNRDHLAFSRLDADTQDLVRAAYPPVVVTRADAASAAATHAALQAAVDRGELPHVGTVLSVSTLLPPDQAARVQALRQAGLDPSDLRVRALEELPDSVVQLLGGTNRVLLLPRGDLYDLRESAALVDELAEIAPDAASEQLAQGAVYRAMIRDTPRIAGLALVLVLGLVVVDLRRRPGLAGAALGSLVLGVGFAAGLGAALGVELTLMNLIGLPILLGIGIDVVLHLAHRLRVGSGLRTVGGAALVSTLTTIASFVALTAASSGGIRSVGRLVVVGLVAVVLTSVVGLPLVWRVGTRRTPPRSPPGP